VTLGQLGRLPQTLALMEEALGTYERVGALRDAARVVAALRSFGIRRVAWPTKTTGHGLASLSETEQRVVHLVVEGLTNAEVGRRLFISRSTVETHLIHIFAKLGVSSRRELAKGALQRSGTRER
jgi:DNA-binding CsgD family transcriptional regulator